MMPIVLPQIASFPAPSRPPISNYEIFHPILINALTPRTLTK